MSRLAQRNAALRPAKSVPMVGRGMPGAQPGKFKPPPRPMGWTERSACVGMDPQLFDATPRPGWGERAASLAAPAIKICAACPVRAECRELGDSMSPVDRRYQVYGGHVYGDERSTGPEPYDPCKGGCGALLRPSGTLRTDYPDTYQHAAHHKCHTCYRQAAA